MRRIPPVSALILSLLLSACGGGGGSESSPDLQATAVPAPPAPTPPVPAPAPPADPAAEPLSARAQVGDLLFHEPSLSASGRQSCASCHAPERGHAEPAGTFLPLGGARLDQQGHRTTPSIRYLDTAGVFRINGNGQPVGGLMWDGRFSNRIDQAAGPLFNPKEMANESLPAFTARLRTTQAWPQLLAVYGLSSDAADAAVLSAVQDALARYQAEDPEFHPFSSRFDDVQAGRAQFTAAEARGLAAFNDPQRGNCASCHSSRPTAGGVREVFTDFRYHALGVPRADAALNLANADPNFFDLGLCARADLAERETWCGKFKTPTLRNVALTAPYFHNARFNTLEEVVNFYAQRDTNPATFYPVVGGVPQVFNDLPASYRGNLERGAPFAPGPQGRPRLSPQDVQDIVAFLRTLTDQ